MKATNSVPITLPDLGTARVVFSLWHVQPGDLVYEGDRVAEVRIPGAIFDVEAPITGRLVERLAQPNDLVVVGQVLGRIE